jgi:hypothetical protein
MFRTSEGWVQVDHDGSTIPIPRTQKTATSLISISCRWKQTIGEFKRRRKPPSPSQPDDRGLRSAPFRSVR